MKTISFDRNDLRSTDLSEEKITESDLALFDRYAITDWKHASFDKPLQLKYGRWLVNGDKSVIFMAIGGGAFEVPEMFVLIYKHAEVHSSAVGAASDRNCRSVTTMGLTIARSS